MKYLIGLFLTLFTFSASSQTIPDSNRAITKDGFFTTLYNPFTGTRAQLNANTNTTYLSAQTTDYGGGNWIKISPISFGYNENNITIVIDA